MAKDDDKAKEEKIKDDYAPITRKEFRVFVKQFADRFAQSEKDLLKKITDRLALVRNGTNGINGKPGRDGKDGVTPEIPDLAKAVLKIIALPKDGSDGADGEDGKDGSPDTADIIRNKLEVLPIGERLSISAIEGLEERLDELKKSLGEGNRNGSFSGAIAYARGQVKVYDLSPSLNGVLTTFPLPAFWRVLLVQSTSAPVIFEPTTDYTTDANAMTITFTSQINAATTLATGQTLTVLYQEP